MEWTGYERYQGSKAGTGGGYVTSLALCDDAGAEPVSVVYDPACSDATPNRSPVILNKNRAAYVMEGSPDDLIAFAQDCVAEARADDYSATELWRYVE